MPKTENVEVRVLELSKWGFKDQTGFVSLSKNLSESDKAELVPGVSFTAEYYIADSGTRYLNKILSKLEMSAEAPKVTESKTDVERAKKYTPKAFTPSFAKNTAPDNTMSKADWASKDRSMLIGGLGHDAAVVVASLVNVEGLNTEGALKAYSTVLNGMIAIRDGVK